MKRTRKADKVLLAMLLAGALMPRVAHAAPPPALVVTPADLRIVAAKEGGYDLYVRKKPGLGSILLTESTKDPALKADNFAYRAPAWNAVNGDEKRILNGKPLPPSNGLYSLIDSTPEADTAFGEAFHIYIPSVLVYGYPWSRSGSVSVGKGTFVNLRAFALPYADYAGAFADNPYEISITTIAKAVPPPEPLPLPAPAPAPAPAPEPEQTVPPLPPPDDRTSARLLALVDDAVGKSIDVVLCLDTTSSMEPYFDELKRNLAPMLRARVGRYKSFRVGLVLFRDYWPDDYITRKFPFTADVGEVDARIQAVKPEGGRDIPEAEHEALLSAAKDFDWQADVRVVILVSDAPPNPVPKGKVGFEDVIEAARAARLSLETLIEPETAPAPSAPHEDLELVTKRLALLTGGSSRMKVVVASETETGSLGAKAGGSLDAPATAALATALSERLSAGAAITALGAGELAVAAAAGSTAAREAALIRAASAAGADYLVLRTRNPYSGPGEDKATLCETVTRLLKARTGEELVRDVLWETASSSGQASLFVNGVRLR